MTVLQAPFPYFGGKSRIADRVWQALGQPEHYIEPFFGSGAVLLRRPGWSPDAPWLYTETVNDKDAWLCNVWRAIQFAPDETAKWADWPINHADLAARRRALIAAGDYLIKNLVLDPEWCDPKLAGYWIWAAGCWIGKCLTRGKLPDEPRLGTRPHLTNRSGVHRFVDIYEWFRVLSARLRYVRVVCGDWKQVCGGDWQDQSWKTVGVFLDPPYCVPDRDRNLYHHDSPSIAAEVMAWCLERGNRENYRIVIAGYEEYEPLLEHGWSMERWSARGGYAGTAGAKVTRGKINRHRERLYFSPYCLKPLADQSMPLFNWAAGR